MRRFSRLAYRAAERLRAAVRSRRLHFFPLWHILRHYTRDQAADDLKAGFNLALLAFPQAIAFALIAGLQPQHGLISVGLGAAVAAAFSGSRLVAMGPGNSTAILLFAGMMAAALTTEEERIVALPLFVFMVGCFHIVGAVANLSIVLNYVSRSVVTASITAAAALIVLNQVQNLLGFRLGEGATFFAILLGTLENLHQTRFPEVVMGAAALAVIAAVRYFFPRAPDAAVTLILMGTAALYLDRAGWDLRYLTGFSLEAIDVFSISFSFEMMGKLAAPAFAVAFLGIVEGASVGRSLASRSGERINVSQVMFGMGMANIANSLFGGMDASGSITRSALNWRSGARTAVSVIVSGGIVIILLFTIGFLIGYIPKAALAAVVLVVALSLFNRHQVSVALRTTPADAVVFTITLAAGLLFTLDMAIYAGVLTSVVLFLRKAGVPDLVEYSFTQEGQLAALEKAGHGRLPGISILHAEGDLFFGSTEIFVEQARQAVLDPQLRVVILRLKNARHLDATCALAIEELLNVLRADDRHLLVSGARKEIYRVFRNSGLLDKLGRDNFFMEKPSNPTLSTRNALKRAQELLGQREADIRIFVDQSKKKAEDKGGNDGAGRT
ncbi:MAG: SulP family inorganic anion transporter [Opitutales bacterium]|nr:SulP family inorganic anion transporter [Opitutales bacterium]